MIGELKRNLTVYAGQNPQAAVQAIYIPEAESPGSWSGRIRSGMTLPVQAFDPLAGVMHDALPQSRGAFAGLIGLCQLQAKGNLLMNFLAPREPKAKADPNKRLIMILLPLLLLVLGAGFAFGLTVKADKERQLTQLQDRKKNLDEVMNKYEEDAKRIKYLGEWTDRNIVWLDELYDLTSRFPDPKGTQVLELKGFPREPEKNSKQKHVARLEVKVQTESNEAIKQLQAELVKDRFYRVEPWRSLGVGAMGLSRFNQQYEVKAELEHRVPGEYTRRLTVSPLPRMKAPLDELKAPPPMTGDESGSGAEQLSAPGGGK